MKTLPLALAVLANSLTSLCDAAVKNVVLVHGAFADGSGWKPVADILERDGYTVYVVQNPLTSFDADVAATRIVLDRAGPCVLVGHSWGGMIITEAGNHDPAGDHEHRAGRRRLPGHQAGSVSPGLCRRPA